MNELPQLASLLKSRNTIDSKMANLIGHAAQLQAIGEFIAARVFQITLVQSSTYDNSDGRFAQGPLAGQTVDIQWHPRHDSVLHLKTDPLPNCYLAFVGPREAAFIHALSVPWVIESVHLFHASELYIALRERNIAIGKNSSIAAFFWERSEIYPAQRNTSLILDEQQRAMLALFR